MVHSTGAAARTIAILVVGLALSATACGGGGGGTHATSTPGEPSGPAPTPVEIKIPGTEPVILPLNAALASDAIELARQTGYTSIACTSDQNAPQKGPACREGEGSGTDVDALASLVCDGSWLRPEAVPDAFQFVLRTEPRLYAMYVPKHVPGAFGADLGVQYVVVMRGGTRLDGTPEGFALHIKEGRIAMLQTVCTSFDSLVTPNLVDSYIVAPTP